MMLRTTCSFHGNEEQLVAVWADFEQAIVHKAIDQWRKQFWACVKAKGEHFEHLLWLAVTYCMLLRHIV